MVLAEPVKYRMTVVSGALPADWLKGISHEPITLQRAHSPADPDKLLSLQQLLEGAAVDTSSTSGPSAL